VSAPKLDGPISEAWRDYAAKVLPPDVPKVQFVECKRAFFGGAQALFQLLDESSKGDSMTTYQVLERMEAELLEWPKRVKDGRE
jgi:hypothetical protein